MYNLPIYPRLEGMIAERGLNYRQTAAGIGLSEQAFSRRMRGRARFKVEEVVRLCNYFDKPIEEVFPVT